MLGEKRERWMELCSRIAQEQDPEHVLELVKQLNQIGREGTAIGHIAEKRIASLAR